MIIWWHRRVLKHSVITRWVSVPLFDIGARGLLIKCECGKVWTK